MRQEGRRAVAPLNTDPRWPDGYRGVAGSGCGRKNHPVLRGLGAQFLCAVSRKAATRSGANGD